MKTGVSAHADQRSILLKSGSWRKGSKPRRYGNGGAVAAVNPADPARSTRVPVKIVRKEPSRDQLQIQSLEVTQRPLPLLKEDEVKDSGTDLAESKDVEQADLDPLLREVNGDHSIFAVNDVESSQKEKQDSLKEQPVEIQKYPSALRVETGRDESEAEKPGYELPVDTDGDDVADDDVNYSQDFGSAQEMDGAQSSKRKGQGSVANDYERAELALSSAVENSADGFHIDAAADSNELLPNK